MTVVWCEDMLDMLDGIPVDTPATTGMPSPRQAELIRKLMCELNDLDRLSFDVALEYNRRMAGHWETHMGGNASRWIDRLIKKIKELRSKVEFPELEDGMYLKDGVVYKVQRAIHGSGRMYAKELVPNQPGEKATFVYAPNMVNRLRPEHKMTMEQAKEWGALYGTCVRCGAVLTAEDSIERMMGPICATKI